MANRQLQKELEALEQVEYLEGVMLSFEDPWYWLTGYALGDKWTPGPSKGFVFTQDEHDDVNPFKRFPNKRYLWHACYEWVHSPNKRTIYAKSRQILISWLLISLHLWLAMTQKGALVFFQNKKEEDSKEMLRRAFVIYDHLPKLFHQLRPVKAPRSTARLEFDGRLSRIRAIPQGGDVLRQNTATAIFSDETAFQDFVEEGYTAARPTLSGGGRFTSASSANGKNFFFSMWNDDKVPFEQKAKGFRVRTNRNGFRAVEIHYSADPDKDPETPAGKKWVEAEKKDMTEEGWDREYEINFAVGGGHRLFKGYNRIVHTGSLLYNKESILIRAWDPGYLHPAGLWAQISTDNQLLVLREFMGWDISVYTFIPEMIELTNSYYPRARILDVCDPAITQKNDKNEFTTLDIMRRQFRVNPRFRRISRAVRLDWVRKLLMIRADDKPGLRMDETNCPILCEGMAGGYVSRKNQPDVPEEDGWYEHHQDTLQYILTIVFRRLGLHLKMTKEQEDRSAKGRSTESSKHRVGVRDPLTGY